MSDVNIIKEYRALTAVILTDEMTDNDRFVAIKLLAEMRAGYQAGMWVEEKMTGFEQAPSKGRLVWGREGIAHYLSPGGADEERAYYTTTGCHAFRFLCGVEHSYHSVPVCNLAEGLRVIADMARADGYECDEHPDAAPATAGAPPLPPSR